MRNIFPFQKSSLNLTSDVTVEEVDGVGGLGAELAGAALDAEVVAVEVGGAGEDGAVVLPVHPEPEPALVALEAVPRT